MTRLEIVYRGYSFFEYRVDGVRLFVDPAFSVYDRGDWVRHWEVEPCDYVFVTHRHFDHFLDSLDVLDACDAVLVAAPWVCDYVRRRAHLSRDRVLPLRSGERARHDAFHVTAIDADHRGFRGLWPDFMRRPSELLALVRTQLPSPSSEAMQSFVFEFGELRVQHHGEGFNDVTDYADLKLLAREQPTPHVVVCAADLTFADDVAEAIEIIRPKAALIYVPHADIYRRFEIKTWPLARFTSAIHEAAPGVTVVEMTPDTRYEVEL